MKLTIVVPCGDQLNTTFVESLLKLNTPGETKIIFETGSLVYDARNKLAAKAEASGSDYTLWIDSDMTFEPEDFIRLRNALKDSGADVICGLYFSRRPPYRPGVYETCDYVQLEDQMGITCKIFENIPDKIFEIAACGFGFVLMKTTVLSKMISIFSLPFSPLFGFGEDLSFCIRARQAGFKIVCAPHVMPLHTSAVLIGGEELKNQWNERSKE